MTLLLREVGRFLLGAGAWILALASISTVVAAVVLYTDSRRIDLRDLGLAAVGAAITAALAHRLGVMAIAPDVGGRPLPILWIAAGAAITAGGLAVWRRYRADE